MPAATARHQPTNRIPPRGQGISKRRDRRIRRTLPGGQKTKTRRDRWEVQTVGVEPRGGAAVETARIGRTRVTDQTALLPCLPPPHGTKPTNHIPPRGQGISKRRDRRIRRTLPGGQKTKTRRDRWVIQTGGVGATRRGMRRNSEDRLSPGCGSWGRIS